MTPTEKETRLQFLSRVLVEYMGEYGLLGGTIDYDGTDCDGFCLADEIRDEVACLSGSAKSITVKVDLSSMPDFADPKIQAIVDAVQEAYDNSGRPGGPKR